MQKLTMHSKKKFNLKSQAGYYLMFLPPAIWMLIFSYLPMAGIYLAFVDYKPAFGIFQSKWIGLDNFSVFLTSPDVFRVFFNTIFYNVLRIALVNLFFGIFFALMLFEIKSKWGNKVFHTAMLLPAFLSWTVVSASLQVFLHPDNGIANAFSDFLGIKRINFYTTASVWPVIITLSMIYKDAGMASVYFYSALLSIDTELFNAASLDGANRVQQIWHISLPAMKNVFAITLITQLGTVLSSGVSPFYELTFNNGTLYDTTQVIGTYLYNGLGGGRYSFLTSVSVVQSVIGLMLVLVSNAIVSRIDPDSAMF